MLYFIFTAFRTWSWHMEIPVIYVSPETLDRYSFPPENSKCIIVMLMNKVVENTGTSPMCLSTLHSGTHLQSTGGPPPESSPQVSHWAPSPVLQQSPGPWRPSISSSPGFLPAPCPSESPLLLLRCGFMVRHRDSPLTWIFSSLVLLSFPHVRSHILISTSFKLNMHSWTCPRACLDSACWSYWKFTTLDPSRLPAIMLYSVR